MLCPLAAVAAFIAAMIYAFTLASSGLYILAALSLTGGFCVFAALMTLNRCADALETLMRSTPNKS